MILEHVLQKNFPEKSAEQIQEMISHLAADLDKTLPRVLCFRNARWPYLREIPVQKIIFADYFRKFYYDDKQNNLVKN